MPSIKNRSASSSCATRAPKGEALVDHRVFAQALCNPPGASVVWRLISIPKRNHGPTGQISGPALGTRLRSTSSPVRGIHGANHGRRDVFAPCRFFTHAVDDLVGFLGPAAESIRRRIPGEGNSHRSNFAALEDLGEDRNAHVLPPQKVEGDSLIEGQAIMPGGAPSPKG